MLIICSLWWNISCLTENIDTKMNFNGGKSNKNRDRFILQLTCFALFIFNKEFLGARRRALMILHWPVIFVNFFYLYTYLCVCVCQRKRECVCACSRGSTWQLHNSTNSTVGGCVVLLCYKYDKSLTRCSLIVP